MAMTLITTNTSSGAATSDFTSSIDSTYKLYIFKFYDVNPANDNKAFSVQFDATDGSDGYDEYITSTAFRTLHKEDDSGTPFVSYHTNSDQAQGQGFQILAPGVGNGADESCAGELYLFNPSNTTYVKHFYATTALSNYADSAGAYYIAGYINNTAAIDKVQFRMSDGNDLSAAGNMDGVIKMYGVG
tara:strand:- start:6 stop:566 length:561 start_codon:yes stop_codon:yes gene_type:complete